MKTFSYGGGVQSTACLVLAAQGKIDFRTFLFCNVGDDSENPRTLEYVHNVAMPYAVAHGLELIELQRHKRDGSVETLRGRLMAKNKAVGIPVRMSNGMPAKRACTEDFKIRVCAKWNKQHGATKIDKAIVGIGISTDEIHRARTDSGIAWQTLEYPLIDLRLSRRDCVKIIEGAGLPVPPKSACYFCPFHSPVEWGRLKREQPELFEDACRIEDYINTKRVAVLKKDKVWLHPACRPLRESVGDQGVFWNETDVCESGYCFV